MFISMKEKLMKYELGTQKKCLKTFSLVKF